MGNFCWKSHDLLLSCSLLSPIGLSWSQCNVYFVHLCVQLRTQGVSCSIVMVSLVCVCVRELDMDAVLIHSCRGRCQLHATSYPLANSENASEAWEMTMCTYSVPCKGFRQVWGKCWNMDIFFKHRKVNSLFFLSSNKAQSEWTEEQFKSNRYLVWTPFVLKIHELF